MLRIGLKSLQEDKMKSSVESVCVACNALRLYKVAEQEVSLPVIIGSCRAIIDPRVDMNIKIEQPIKLRVTLD